MSIHLQEKLQSALHAEEPLWLALKKVYDQTQGCHKTKSTKLANLVAKFVLHQTIANYNEITENGDAFVHISRLISQVNEIHPFNTQIAVQSANRGLRNYLKLINSPNALETVDEVLTNLIGSEDLVSEPAVEGIKDKVIGAVKKVFGDKGGDDKKDEKPKDDKKDDAKAPPKKASVESEEVVGAQEEGGETSAEEVEVTEAESAVQEEEQPHQPTQAEEVLPPSSTREEVPETSAGEVQEHQDEACNCDVAWELLTLQFAYGKE